MQFPIFIGLHRSRVLLFLLFFIYFLAALGVLLVAWPLLLRLALVLVAGFLGISAWRRLRLLPRYLALYGDGRLELGEEEGRLRQVTLLPGAVLLPWLCVFHYEDEGVVNTFTLLWDAADQENLRRLRLWLRWNNKPRNSGV